jgi:hypothetical protein
MNNNDAVVVPSGGTRGGGGGGPRVNGAPVPSPNSGNGNANANANAKPAMMHVPMIKSYLVSIRALCGIAFCCGPDWHYLFALFGLKCMDSANSNTFDSGV